MLSRAAFAEVIANRTLLHYAIYLTRNRDAADELMQSTMERAWRFRHTFKHGNEIAWLRSVMRSVHRYAYRRSKIVQFVELPEDRSDLEPTYPCAGEAYCALHELAEAAEDLSPRQRAAFLLTQVEGFEYSETAELLGCAIGTIKSSVNRATVALGTRNVE